MHDFQLFRFKRAFQCFSVGCIFLFSTMTFATDNCGSLDRIEVALHLIRVLNPATVGKEFNISFSPGTGGPLSSPIDAGTVLIALDKDSRTINGDANPTRQETVPLPLYLRFSFVAGGTAKRTLECRPLQFINDTTSKQLKKARTEIDTHSEWTDEQTLAAARRLGMQLGPEEKTAVLRLIPLAQLSKFYGPLKINSATFDMYGGTKCSGCSFAYLYWTVYIEEVGTARQLHIVIDPFLGRIDGITETQ